MRIGPILSPLLVLVLLVTSGTMAVARGHMAHTAMLHVLCLNGEAQVVAIGPDGSPVEDKPVCPDCVMGALLGLAGADPDTDFVALESMAEPAPRPLQSTQHTKTRTVWARAPPAAV